MNTFDNENNKYTGENGYIFYLQEKIGNGGNGEVYRALLIDSNSNAAVKFFTYDGKYKEKRYERFKREAKVVHKKLNNVDGVIKVLDHYLPNDLNSDDEPWYLMPLAEKMEIGNKNYDEITIIDYFLQLANTIKTIHDEGMCHRDIKPENILLIDNKAYISDFGLVLCDDEDRLTGENERIGAFIISPPEFFHPRSLSIEELKYGDVYLFAKTLWIFLKNDKRGFTGEYDITDSSLRLNSKNVKTLYPINYLIENATKNNIENRIDISKCIELLILQDKINHNNIDKETVNKYILWENLRITFNDIKHDYVIYSDKKKIYEILNKIVKYSKIEIINNEETIKSFFPIKIIMDNDLIFLSELRGKNEIKYKIRTKQLMYIENEKIEIELERFNDNEINNYCSLRESLLNVNNNIYISDDYYLRIQINRGKI